MLLVAALAITPPAPGPVLRHFREAIAHLTRPQRSSELAVALSILLQAQSRPKLNKTIQQQPRSL
jgi:hypothetical protein